MPSVMADDRKETGKKGQKICQSTTMQDMARQPKYGKNKRIPQRKKHKKTLATEANANKNINKLNKQLKTANQRTTCTNLHYQHTPLKLRSNPMKNLCN
jgi:hypothetical protein